MYKCRLIEPIKLPQLPLDFDAGEIASQHACKLFLASISKYTSTTTFHYVFLEILKASIFLLNVSSDFLSVSHPPLVHINQILFRFQVLVYGFHPCCKITARWWESEIHCQRVITNNGSSTNLSSNQVETWKCQFEQQNKLNTQYPISLLPRIVDLPELQFAPELKLIDVARLNDDGR